MKITFVVPTLNLSGGLRVVSIYADLLAQKGHQVTVVSRNRAIPTLKDKLKAAIKWQGFKIKPDGFDRAFFKNPQVNIVVLDKRRPVTGLDVPDADIVIATFWNTAEWVSEYPDEKGKKIYFLQHYETHDWLPVERVKATLRHPFKKIAVAGWIADIIKNEYHDLDVIVVPNGVSCGQFNAPKRSKQDVPTVGVMYSHRSFKGFDIALAAVKLARQRLPRLNFIMFGADHMQIDDPALKQDCQFVYKPEQQLLSNLYSSCDAWIFSSRNEGFGLPILEAMACRTPVIGTRTGAAPDLITEKNGILINIDDTQAMAEAIVSIATMPNADWLELSENAYQTATKHTWDDAANQFEHALTYFYEHA